MPITFAPSVGVRSSRKIIGEYNPTEHDVRNQVRFADSIGIVPEFIAAAQSLKDKRICREVDRRKVQNRLQKQDVRIY